jgi:hypothetical protein
MVDLDEAALSPSDKASVFRRAGERCECSRRDHHHPLGRCWHYFWSFRSARFCVLEAPAQGREGSGCAVLCARCSSSAVSDRRAA